MNKISTLTCILAAASLVAFAEEPAPQPDAAFFTKLRMDTAARKDFNPAWKVEEDREAVFTAFRAKDYKKAFDLGERWLVKCPVDADAHSLCAAAAAQINDLQGSIRHLYFAYGLMASLTQSGDGRTPKTGYKVISVEEEYSLLRIVRAKVIQQSLIAGPCDQMDCELPDGTKTTLYFDVSIAMKAEAKSFGK